MTTRSSLPAITEAEQVQDDNYYLSLLRKLSNPAPTLRILAYTILTENSYIPNIETFLKLPPNRIRRTLIGLETLIKCQRKSIRFDDDDFPDFLLNQSRSAEFYINWAEWHAKFAHEYFERVKDGTCGMHELWLIAEHIRNINASSQLHKDILSFRFTQNQISYLRNADDLLWSEVSHFLTAIKQLNFSDNNKAYNLQRRRMTSLLKRHPNHYRGQILLLEADHNIDLKLRRQVKIVDATSGSPGGNKLDNSNRPALDAVTNQR